MRLIVDGKPVEFKLGDNVLVALLRHGIYPNGGGCLCLGGDCPHCLAMVNGVAYVRTCQVKAQPGMIVESFPSNAYPPMPTNSSRGEVTPARNLHCDVVVVGAGEAGRTAVVQAEQAGKNVILLDANATPSQEVIGIYAGPLVVARTPTEMWHVHVRDEVVVATGAAELQPVAPGNDLKGIVTARAATALAQAGVNLGRVVSVGVPPVGVNAEAINGVIVRFEGEAFVRAIVIVTPNGQERRIECDTVSVGLGFQPRDTLLRMSQGYPERVRAVGTAAQKGDLPSCPIAGRVCSCSNVTVEDLKRVYEKGFNEVELVKRATLAGTGTCQGAVCMPHVRSFLAKATETSQKADVLNVHAPDAPLQPNFTARPVTRQLTMGEVSAGAYHQATPRTALDSEHRRLGAVMDRIGGWWRPWHYGNPMAEYWAAREAVSIGDVGTLGKMIVSGPDVLELLERLYPSQVSTIAAGRSRYVINLNERGYVLDDGLICKESDHRYYLTFTTGGANHAEMWVRDWAESWRLNVRIMNQTMSLGAINVTGPLATELLRRLGFEQTLKFMQNTRAVIAAVPCQVFRLSFTGETSYELHHPITDSVALWQRLMTAGKDMGIKPHGLKTLLQLRLEKGHVIVGQDTDFDSTPRRIGMEWAVSAQKMASEAEFVGKHALRRTNEILPDKQLVGFEMADEGAPLEGANITYDNDYVGYVTSSAYSPILGKAVMMGWLKYVNGALPIEVMIEGKPARRVDMPFYDKEGVRARA